MNLIVKLKMYKNIDVVKKIINVLTDANDWAATVPDYFMKDNKGDLSVIDEKNFENF